MRNFKYAALNGRIKHKRFNYKHYLIVIVLISLLVLSVSAFLRKNVEPALGHCEGISIFSKKEMKKFEPSDIVWNINDQASASTFYVVSDDGRFIELDIHGTVVQTWELGEDIDLEAVALVPGE